jgi:hypothetical protein
LEESDAATKRLREAMQDIDMNSDGGISLNELIVFGLSSMHRRGSGSADSEGTAHDKAELEGWDLSSVGAGSEQLGQIMGSFASRLTTRLDCLGPDSTVDVPPTPESDTANEYFQRE